MRVRFETRRPLAVALAALALALVVTGLAAAKMTSTKISPTLCETTGGGKFVAIPGFMSVLLRQTAAAGQSDEKRRFGGSGGPAQPSISNRIRAKKCAPIGSGRKFVSKLCGSV